MNNADPSANANAPLVLSNRKNWIVRNQWSEYWGMQSYALRCRFLVMISNSVLL